MTTARTICDDAVRLTRKVGTGTTSVPGEYSSEALKHLNRMMQGLAARDAPAEWATLTLSDTVPVDEELDDTLVYALALRLLTPLGASPPDPDLKEEMKQAQRRLKAKFQVIEPVILDLHNTYSRNRRSM